MSELPRNRILEYLRHNPEALQQVRADERHRIAERVRRWKFAVTGCSADLPAMFADFIEDDQDGFLVSVNSIPCYAPGECPTPDTCADFEDCCWPSSTGAGGESFDERRPENDRLREALLSIKARCDRIIAGEFGGVDAALDMSNEARRALR